MHLDCEHCNAELYDSGTDDPVETGITCSCGGTVELRGLSMVCQECDGVCVSFSCCGASGPPV